MNYEVIPKVDVLIGGQFGSEGKGVVVANIADDYGVHVRVGAPNAGHSFLGPDGKLWKMQTVPCGWININATLIIGRGGLVNPVLLKREIEQIATIDPTIYNRLYIDELCGVCDNRFHYQEGGVNGEMHRRIGSTGEGIGPARMARISRDPQQFRLYGELASHDPWFSQFICKDTPAVIAQCMKHGAPVLLEGAQGQGLSLIHGPWPYCTSTDPGPAQLAADVGIPIHAIRNVIACFRTFPIRVAGNSGPLSGEITWESLSRQLGKDVQERTTVTNKIRRIAEWDDQIATQCRVLHRPNRIALMFVDYLDRANEGVTKYENLTPDTHRFIERVETLMQAPVSLIGTGGPKLTVIKCGR